MLTLALSCGGREYVLEQLATDPMWQRVRIKSPEGAASALVEIAKRIALAENSAMILPEIQGFYRDYVKVNGPKPPGSTYGDWEEGHDDGVMKLFENFANVLSASWLNFTSTDVRLWQDGEDEKLAKSFAEETWKQMTWQRSNNQILAGVGIVHDDLAQFGYMPPEVLEAPKPEFSQMHVNTVINRIMLSMPDPETLADDLDFASDDDDALAAGAAERLGVSTQDIELLREARGLAAGVVEAWINAIEAGELLDETEPANASPVPDLGPDLPTSLTRLPPLPPLPGATGAAGASSLPAGLPPIPTGTKPLPPLPTSMGTGSAPPVNQGRGGKRTRTPETPPDGYVPLEVLRSIKEHSGIKDEDMADMMGISRPTLANIMKGKGWYVPPDPSRRAAIKNMLTVHINALGMAHDVL